jgi:hypothetical protein
MANSQRHCIVLPSLLKLLSWLLLLLLLLLLPPPQVLWGHCADLLQRGFVSGSILTVDPEDARLLGKPWTRR